MKITLDQEEIETAIKNFVGSQGIAVVGKDVGVSLIAGRGPNGFSAAIDITDGNNSKPATTAATVEEATEETVDPTDTPFATAADSTPEDTPLFGKS